MTETSDVHEASRGHSALGQLAWTWRDIQQLRLATAQRGGVVESAISPKLAAIEKELARLTVKELKRHPIWPWLEQFPGLRGVHTARLVALIGDPRRFPGQMCTEGHHLPDIYPVGSPCPNERNDEQCIGRLLERRSGTGKRSLWHYLGLHVVDGRSPRKRRGVKADWNTIGRTIVVGKLGIADHIVQHRVPVYRDIYDRAKLRLQERVDIRPVDVAKAGAAPALRTAVAEMISVIEPRPGNRSPEAVDTEDVTEVDAGGLKPFQIDDIARKIAAKAFVNDLLQEWKRLLVVTPRVPVRITGEGPPLTQRIEAA